MKKKGALFLLLISIIFFISFAVAANQTVSDKAYSCLQSKVTSQCSSLSTEEKIFSLLAIQSCKTEVLSDSLANQCWPASGCKIKTTAQAILSLRNVNADTSIAEKWLIDQTSPSSDLDWFLQVESNNETSCTATLLSSGASYTFSVNEDKTVDISSGGNCLSSYGGYWLQISPNCYNQDIKISCHDNFLTSLLYKKKTSSTIYVSQKTDSAPAEGSTTETVNSYCFKEGSSCSYEGTLWAAFVLKYRGYKSVSSYIPYLEAMAEDNSQYLPDAFLYYLTGNYQNELASLQQQSQFWSASGDKFYDTAVALLPLQGQTTAEKTNAITWLSQVQGTDGCWQGNKRDTAFLLYSIWPKLVANTPTAQDCESSGNHCMSDASCSALSGNQLPDFTGCFSNICCDKAIPLQSCSDQNGNLCNSGETCIGGSSRTASDATSSSICCVGGTCGTPQTQPTQSTCEPQGGICKASCSSSEDTSSYYTCSSSAYSCCIQKPASDNTWIIIVLIILIVLVLLGILFRKKLRMFFLKLKSGKGKPKPMMGGPRFPPTSSQRVYPGAVQRRIMQPVQRAPQRRPATQDKSDFDEVLKKLKEIGK